MFAFRLDRLSMINNRLIKIDFIVTPMVVFPLIFSAGHTYKKTVYREYNAGFKQAKVHPLWSGIYIMVFI